MFDSQNTILQKRRETVFLILAGLFLGSLTMLNILGISRFIDLSFSAFGMQIPFIVAVGVLPYPITFLCTDFISELYGRRRANTVVWVGLLLNLWVIFILWLGGILPPQPEILPETGLPPEGADGRVFFEVQKLTFGATAASMIAYLTAQFCDVHVFHYLKKLTNGKHLWLRNNGSTLLSQLIDSVAVILITHFYANALPVSTEKTLFSQLMIFILSGYIFKLVAALVDTIPFYIGVKLLSKYLQVELNKSI
ncbi:MAG: transporter [Flavobacteriales bacterium]|nr:queuosine precursor transporter [Bacteroidales bacterium AH-315-I05]PCJ88105.1 MAG: transporter [Flavobacteriales bacterium]